MYSHAKFQIHISKNATLISAPCRSQFEVPLRPKAAILPLLSLAVSTWETKWVAVFSSTTGLLGYPSQTNYGAANHFLDTLCNHTRKRSVHCL